mmetsp:Transcript_71971/g.119844  ORF Transcript_71971/g.119844 Transcript_71971/m.119844 type:complete len:81 (+) Transcript_71971:2-244(+)
MRMAGDAPDGSPAHLVLQAAQPWSRHTHALFPTAMRARAVKLTLLGHLLSHEPRFCMNAVGIFDVWMEFVIPHALGQGDE